MTSANKARNLASTVADLMGAQYVVDASAGIGGNTLGFAMHAGIQKVISYEAARDRWVMLHNNIALYNLVAKVKAFNQAFEIGEDLQLLDIQDKAINSKTVVYFDPPWLPPNASIDKSNYIMAGMQLSGKTLEYWCQSLVAQGYRGVVLHVPPGYNLVLPGQLIDDASDRKSRLIYYSLNEDVVQRLATRLSLIQKEKPVIMDLSSEEVPSAEKAIGEIPPPARVKGPKVVLQTYLTPDFPRKRYVKEHFNPKAIHLGQRKLLISEIEFLTRIIKRATELGPDGFAPVSPAPGFLYTLLYVGAAPGQHIPILSEMFPEVKFVLYDPAPFAIKPTKAIEIHQELFTDELVAQYATDGKKENHLLFVSDIRSAPRTGYQDTDTVDPEFEDEVRKNLAQQRRWVEQLRPVRSLLKFRLPFTDEADKATTEYFDGVVNFQAYAPPQSAETRLEVGNKPKIITYNHTTYEQQMFYFNTQYRVQSFVHYNRRYGWSYDTIREFFVLKKYIALRGEGEKAIPEYFAKFDTLTDKPEKKIARILEKY